MKEKIELLYYFILTLIKLCKPGGVKAVMAENITMRQQLITLNRGRLRAVAPKTFDRFFFVYMAKIIGEKRLQKIFDHYQTRNHSKIS